MYVATTSDEANAADGPFSAACQDSASPGGATPTPAAHPSGDLVNFFLTGSLSTPYRDPTPFWERALRRRSGHRAEAAGTITAPRGRLIMAVVLPTLEREVCDWLYANQRSS